MFATLAPSASLALRITRVFGLLRSYKERKRKKGLPVTRQVFAMYAMRVQATAASRNSTPPVSVSMRASMPIGIVSFRGTWP